MSCGGAGGERLGTWSRNRHAKWGPTIAAVVADLGLGEPQSFSFPALARACGE